MTELSDTSILIAKPIDCEDFIIYNNIDSSKIACINRKDRETIFELLVRSNVMLNVTKDKYSNAKFIPARIFEALIFGMIPISYNFEFLCPAFSFDSIEDLTEIYKYLQECDSAGLHQAYKYFIDAYIEYSSSLVEPVCRLHDTQMPQVR
jgi:hypothetical protein